jgi:hypothetical protein
MDLWKETIKTEDQLKWALTSPAGCGRSLGIVRLRTKTTEFCFLLMFSFIQLAMYQPCTELMPD